MSAFQNDSVSSWLQAMQTGEQRPVSRLWERYFCRMTNLVRGRLRNSQCRVADEEDVALSAFESFCQGMGQGRFPELRNREDLWSVLVVLTLRKAFNLIKRETAQKRGGEQAIVSDERILNDLMDREPTPEISAAMTEKYQALMDQLPDHRFRELVMMKLDGRTNEECAVHLGRSRITVQRMLNLVRQQWMQDVVE